MMSITSNSWKELDISMILFVKVSSNRVADVTVNLVDQ